ncbi:(2Fe-2S)-binding protein [Candidatus Bathyarchaeota archaeon]|nr:(2Fe-2S)-binding protein [Candidatus Bathyarchaeota archaeon]
MKTEIIINNKKRTFDLEPNTLLLNLLRDELNLTGSKYGCGVGECGACTVLLDGNAILACMTLAVDVNGHKVDTIEGLSNGENLHPIQEAYLDEAAIQCGFCTPGFIMATAALLNENADPSEFEVREYLRGNLCRCTGYVNIVKAVKSAAKRMKKK